jgi:hypothetical protein
MAAEFCATLRGKRRCALLIIILLHPFPEAQLTRCVSTSLLIGNRRPTNGLHIHFTQRPFSSLPIAFQLVHLARQKILVAASRLDHPFRCRQHI